MNAAWWTDADQSELDVLLQELSLGYFEHRERCEACSPEPCLVLGGWNAHLAECIGCRGDAPLFVLFLHKVYRAGVLNRSELLDWIELHGSVLRMGPPLQDDDQFDEEAFAALEREPGAE